MRRQVLGVQHAEVLRHLTVLAHRVGNARPRVHAGERGSDQRQEDGERFGQHEDPSATGAKQSVTHDDHHVTDGRGGP